MKSPWGPPHGDLSLNGLYALPCVSDDKHAKAFPSEEALKEYLKEHPNAERRDHEVKKTDPRDYARERAKHAPPKEKHRFVGVPSLASAARVAARFAMACRVATRFASLSSG